MKNRKGFTLVEILAVIVILALIMIIVVPTVLKSSKASKQKLYDTKITTSEQALLLWGTDNKLCFNSDATDNSECLIGINKGCTDENGIVKCKVKLGDMASYGLIKYDKNDNEVVSPLDNTSMNETELTICYNQETRDFTDCKGNVMTTTSTTTTSSSSTTTTTAVNTVIARLAVGSAISANLKKLASNDDSKVYNDVDNLIKKITRSSTPPAVGVKTLSIKNNNYADDPDIIAWYDNGTIYIYSEAGHIKAVTYTFQYAFNNMQALENVDLSFIDATDAVTFERTFMGCKSLKNISFQPNTTKKVANGNRMFAETVLNNTKLSGLDLSGITNTGYMFAEIQATNFDFSKLNLTNVMDAKYMFSKSTIDKIDLTSSNFSKLTGPQAMFHMVNAETVNLSGVSFGTTMENMFNQAKIDTLNLTSINTSQVTSMKQLFFNASIKNFVGFSDLDTENVTTMESMFYKFTIGNPFSFVGLNTSKVTNMSNMFASVSGGNLDVTGLNTSSVTNMSRMFNAISLSEIEGLTTFNTSKVTNMSDMFANCPNLTVVDISSFDTSKVTTFDSFFYLDSKLVTAYASSKYVNNTGVKTNDMFVGTTSIVGGMGSKWGSDCWNYSGSEPTFVCARIDGGQAMPGYFTDKGGSNLANLLTGSEVNVLIKKLANTSGVTNENFVDSKITSIKRSSTAPSSSVTKTNLADSASIPVYAWYDSTAKTIWWHTTASKVYMNRDSSRLFRNFSALTTIDVSQFDSEAVSYMGAMFAGDTQLTSITGLTSFNTPSLRDMSNMFGECTSLRSLDLSSFNTSNLAYMDNMFSDTTSLTQITGLDKFDTSNVTNMARVFQNAGISSLNVSSWNTSKVTNMSGMFFGTSNLSQIVGLTSFNTSNVTDMANMFSSSGVTSLDVSSFDTSKVTSMRWLFGSDSKKLAQITGLNKFNTSNVTDMSGMFYGVALKTVDVSSFNTSKVTNMNAMFQDSSLTSITGLTSFNTSNVTNMRQMFYRTPVTTLDLSSFNTSKVTDFYCMFINSPVKTIYASANFVVNSSADFRMFDRNSVTVGGRGTTYSSGSCSNTVYSNQCGKIDKVGSPGLFTAK